MLKYLRIAVTALCLTACVLIVALWVRSYEAKHEISTRIPLGYLEVASHKGRLHVRVFDSEPVTLAWPYRTLFKVHHLIPALFAAALAAVPWIRWSNRFSLRTLIIATTLVAVGLGFVVLL
jgi:hypothetical protein